MIIDGVEKRIALGTDVKLNGDFKNPTIKIIADKERHFVYGGFSFKYPAYFTFESDVNSDNFKSWTMSGNDLKIMVFRVKGAFTHESLAKQLIKKWGDKAKLSDTEITLGGKKYSGKRVDGSLAGSGFIQNMFLISEGETNVVFVIQDSPESEKQSLEESKFALSLLTEEFQFKK